MFHQGIDRVVSGPAAGLRKKLPELFGEQKWIVQSVLKPLKTV
jgi:hypothetical protein